MQHTTSIATGAWRLDPEHSQVEFHVRHFWGLMIVKGSFSNYEGTLNLDAVPAVTLTIQADSLDTKQKKRDEHLRSKDFFHIAQHPELRFESDTTTLTDGTLRVSGTLHTAGKSVALDADARITERDGLPYVEATTTVDHREFGMTWSPLGMLRAPSTLIVSGNLIPAEPEHASLGT